ncbi:hypothetical protein KR222_011130 [Zaprionus bogoriensis]|nr:hypothetical protein KR222_011130 [Zaprionus bogoriensis]
MRTITVCLLLLVSASCLLSANANADVSAPSRVEEADLIAALELLDEQLDDDYMDFEEFGFIRTVRKALKKALKTVRGVNCILKETIAILAASTGYVDAIDACGTAVPKDVAAIVTSVKNIISICNDIINLNSKLCAAESTDDDTTASKPSTAKCSWNLLKALMKLTRKINRTLKQIAKLPTDTSSCFVDATNSVKTSYNNYLPNINTCIDQM